MGSNLVKTRIPRLESLGGNAAEAHKAEQVGGARLVVPQHPVLDVIRGVLVAANDILDAGKPLQAGQCIGRRPKYHQRMHLHQAFASGIALLPDACYTPAAMLPDHACVVPAITLY